MNKKTEPISQKEFELLNGIAAGVAKNQREIADYAGFSLGLTNILLKRLAYKGYLKVLELNNRKIEYLLTAKGFSEKARKSIQYTRRTLNNLKLMRGVLKNLIEVEIKKGSNTFYIQGQGDLADLLFLATRDVSGGNARFETYAGATQNGLNSVLLVTEPNHPFAWEGGRIDVLEWVSKEWGGSARSKNTTETVS